ncbi:MAG: head-tail connector protein [Rhizobiaceae bacterium]|nr:head-tail connector protein [Rhizobiaceae bacterium]
MALFRTVEPAAEPVTLADAKAHLRIAHHSEDDLLGGLLRAARDDVERATGVALIDQSWRLTLDRWPRHGIATLPLHPVKEVLSVTVFGAEGEAALVDAASYQLDAASRPARLLLAERPPALHTMNGIEIDVVAGFGEAGPDVPDLLKHAILMLVAHWYEFRAAYGAADQPVSYPAGYDRLIAGYRRGRL